VLTSVDGDPATSRIDTDPLDKDPEFLEHVEMRVSSRHLTLASPYWDRMLNGEMKEADNLRKNGIVKIAIEDVDADALLLVFNIVHCKTYQVPRQVDLDMLAKIAVTVDIYQCHEAVAMYTDTWLGHLRHVFPNKFSRDAVLWIAISRVFRKQEDFKSATRLALMHSRRSVQDLQLPIPQSVIGTSCSIIVGLELTSM
jgi:hypothetical protein